jgi:hypothetical protein
MKLLPEVKLIYNVQDDRYYIYLGEDYVNDTQYKDKAIQIFNDECKKLKCPHLNTEETHPYGWITCKDCGKLL